MAKTNETLINKRTALVYLGAAILIAIVGIRTLLSVSEDWHTMEFVTLGAIMIEFGVLLLYAYTIYDSTPEQETGSQSETNGYSGNGAAKNGMNFKDPMLEVVSNLNQYQASLVRVLDELNALTQSVNTMTDENERLKTRIEIEQRKADIAGRYIGKNKSAGNRLIAEMDQELEHSK